VDLVIIHAYLQLAVDLSPMPDADDENDKAVIFHSVNDTIGANPDAKVALVSFQADRTCWTRVFSQGAQRLVNSLKILSR
jgi:hypothetical protein